MTYKQIMQTLWVIVLLQLGVTVPQLPSPKPLSYYINKPSEQKKKK